MKKLLLTITTLFLGLFTMASCEFTKDNSKDKVENSIVENSIVENSKVYLQFEAKASDEKVEDQSVLNELNLYFKKIYKKDNISHFYSCIEIEQDGAFYKQEDLFTASKPNSDFIGTYKKYFEKKSNIGTEYITEEYKVTSETGESGSIKYSTKGKIYLNNKFVNIDEKNKDLADYYLDDFDHIFRRLSSDHYPNLGVNIYKQGDTLYSKNEKGYIIFLKNKIIFKSLNIKFITYYVFK